MRDYSPTAPRDEIPVLTIQKTARQRLQISHKVYRGVPRVDVRLYVVDGSGNWVPTARGISLRHEQLAQVIQGLLVASREVGQGGMPK
ncbi:transcriptional coactivator p15/PC4 family protein [Burkholderia gladioli]|uniref:transcriptional coactivator p15/PC4 family protein n=1 Tax=Burkholderia gladioli TaxID=28095 RepID=UPI00163FED96|nr:transcriptional coactivator p15/PC4 family protein [Burkholderia gladioli]MBJ9675239.1 transcriptional coactivator p15/PC4 family protein [Burkholderia gladioli]MDN7463491.1 transcriptional coactivator p15/PC4 family protein [Burkholderia gladioli]